MEEGLFFYHHYRRPTENMFIFMSPLGDRYLV
nr:MAG TPA: hypothetical protein [Caudoviricetes sp.]DAM55708.1 MAG TPA: hypothetical protein [Caudoviricetes sp.]